MKARLSRCLDSFPINMPTSAIMCALCAGESHLLFNAGGGSNGTDLLLEITFKPARHGEQLFETLAGEQQQQDRISLQQGRTAPGPDTSLRKYDACQALSQLCTC